MEIRHGLNAHRRVAPALVGGVIALGAIGGFFAAREVSREPSRADLQAAASSAATAVTARLAADAQLLVASSASIGGDPSQPDETLSAALHKITLSGQVLALVRTSTTMSAPVAFAIPDDERSAPFLNLDLAAREPWRLALELARDRAGAGAAVDTGPDGQPTVLNALPVFGSTTVPTDIAGRRAALKGFVVTLTPASTMAGLPSAEGSDVAVRLLDGGVLLDAQGEGATSSPPSSPISLNVTANGVAWTVQAWATPSESGLPWALLVLGLLLALIAGLIVLSRERALEAVVADTNARSQELALVARTGPLLQQSLALGDLLPVFVVEVSDELRLDAISISLITDTGELARVFSLGTGSHTTAAPTLGSITPVPASVPAGEVVTVPLHRLGRIVGTFQARAVAGLTQPQVDTLNAVCALLAAAIGNVRLFQDEQDMVARLRDLDRMKTSFVGAVSHELRTSVAAIEGFAGLLEMDASSIDEQKRADYVERINRNARSLGILVDDLLDFARYQQGGLTASLRPIDLSDLVPKIVDQLSSVLSGRPLTTDIEPAVTALADNVAVERILTNLLSNAAKYTPPASAVEVRLDRQGPDAVLTVRDHGPGVPPAEREKVFELFYRSTESARGTRGVGIGLALARQLALHLNGTIGVDEAPGGGARFRVTIPLAGPSEDEVPTPVAVASQATVRQSGA